MMLLLSAALLAPAPLEAAPAFVAHATAHAAAQVRLGGYRPIETDNPSVVSAADFAAQSVGEEVEQIHEAQVQVVAGRNFKLSFTTTDGRRYDAVVFQGDMMYAVRSMTEREEAPPTPEQEGGDPPANGG